MSATITGSPRCAAVPQQPIPGPTGTGPSALVYSAGMLAPAAGRSIAPSRKRTEHRPPRIWSSTKRTISSRTSPMPAPDAMDSSTCT